MVSLPFYWRITIKLLWSDVIEWKKLHKSQEKIRSSWISQTEDRKSIKFETGHSYSKRALWKKNR